MLSRLYGPTLTSVHDYWKNHSFDYTDLCWKVIPLLFNTLSRFVIVFLPRSKRLLISPSIIVPTFLTSSAQNLLPSLLPAAILARPPPPLQRNARLSVLFTTCFRFLAEGVMEHPPSLCVMLSCSNCVQLVWLSGDPMDCGLPGFSVHRTFQVRILERVVIFYSRGSSWLRDWTWVCSISCVAGRCFTYWAIGEAPPFPIK